MSDQLINYTYNGNPVTFQLADGNVMVNLTEMAKPFGKETSHFLANKQTQEFISALDSKLGIPSLGIVRGGNNPGTWAHQKLALKFAAWLNPHFELWVYDRVEELLKHGFTALPQTIEDILANPDLIIGLAGKLKQERAARLAAEQTANLLRPKAELMDKVLDADEKIDIGQAAKILGLPYGRNTLFQELRRRGIFFANRNEPKQQYVNQGYFQLKESWIDRNNHDGFVVIKVLVTQKCLSFINTLFANTIPDKQTAKLA